jgi:hypothetical protein
MWPRNTHFKKYIKVAEEEPISERKNAIPTAKTRSDGTNTNKLIKNVIPNVLASTPFGQLAKAVLANDGKTIRKLMSAGVDPNVSFGSDCGKQSLLIIEAAKHLPHTFEGFKALIEESQKLPGNAPNKIDINGTVASEEQPTEYSICLDDAGVQAAKVVETADQARDWFQRQIEKKFILHDGGATHEVPFLLNVSMSGNIEWNSALAECFDADDAFRVTNVETLNTLIGEQNATGEIEHDQVLDPERMTWFLDTVNGHRAPKHEVGAQVEITGIKTNPKFNGRVGVITEAVFKTDGTYRWNVDVGDGNSLVYSYKPENLKLVVQAALKDQKSLQPGDRVKVHGYKKTKKKFNGKQGKLIERDQTMDDGHGSWVVDLDDFKGVKIFNQNNLIKSCILTFASPHEAPIPVGSANEEVGKIEKMFPDTSMETVGALMGYVEEKADAHKPSQKNTMHDRHEAGAQVEITGTKQKWTAGETETKKKKSLKPKKEKARIRKTKTRPFLKGRVGVITEAVFLGDGKKGWKVDVGDKYSNGNPVFYSLKPENLKLTVQPGVTVQDVHERNGTVMLRQEDGSWQVDFDGFSELKRADDLRVVIVEDPTPSLAQGLEQRDEAFSQAETVIIGATSNILTNMHKCFQESNYSEGFSRKPYPFLIYTEHQNCFSKKSITATDHYKFGTFTVHFEHFDFSDDAAVLQACKCKDIAEDISQEKMLRVKLTPPPVTAFHYCYKSKAALDLLLKNAKDLNLNAHYSEQQGECLMSRMKDQDCTVQGSTIPLKILSLKRPKNKTEREALIIYEDALKALDNTMAQLETQVNVGDEFKRELNDELVPLLKQAEDLQVTMLKAFDKEIALMKAKNPHDPLIVEKKRVRRQLAEGLKI